MRRTMIGLVLVVALGMAALALTAAPQASPASVPLHTAAAVSLNLNESDPASDVYALWTSNGSHVTSASGAWLMNPFPSEVNLIHLQSLQSGTNVDLFVKVQGSIATRANTTYEVRLYTTSDNSTHFIVRYNNGTTNIRSNHTGSAVTNLAGTTISPASTLNLVVPIAGLGNITTWHVDASTKMIGTNYTFEDFIWNVPGNPGSAPAAIQGHVTDASSGQGLAGVNVSAAGFYTTTNATGYYLLPATYGNITVTFSLSGYGTVTKQVTVLVDHTATLDAQLSTGAAGLSSSEWIVILAVVVVAAIAIVAVVALRRRKARPPERPPPAP